MCHPGQTDPKRENEFFPASWDRVYECYCRYTFLSSSSLQELSSLSKPSILAKLNPSLHDIFYDILL